MTNTDSNSKISKSDDNNNEDYIIFSLDDEDMLDLGRVIETKYSREFLKITQIESLNLQKIADIIEGNEKTKLSNATYHEKTGLSNATHHKKRLKRIGLIKSTQKQQETSNRIVEVYSGIKIIIIAQDELVEKIQNSEKLKDAIDDILKN